MPRVLFVCTANRVRSPMAAELFRALLKQRRDDWRNWQVESAGTWAVPGQPVVVEVQSVLQSRGLDASQHRSRTVNGDMLEKADLVLVMEAHQHEALRLEYPEYGDRIYLLSEMVGQRFDIDDPIGGPLSDYEAAARNLQQVLSEGFANIIRMALEHESRRGSNPTGR
jgi:protein-tyrosine phosphatase